MVDVIRRREEVAELIGNLPPDKQTIAFVHALALYGGRAEHETKKQAEEELANRYRFDTVGYIRDKLGWEPWAGDEGPGQLEIIEAYELALRQQIERRDYELGLILRDQLKYWEPGQIIQNWIRLEAGHTVGKTKLASGLANHFHDCFIPAIGYAFAPSWPQIHDLLFKEIKGDREGKGLPGRILDLRLDRGPKHFLTGKATNDAGGRGTERAQGQHGPFLIYIIDEAEGVADFIFEALKSMASGGIVIVLMMANPRTRTSQFHKLRLRSNVRSFRMSCIHHPNVVLGREVVPNAVRREYVETMIEEHCDIVQVHSEDDHTFTVPFPVRADGKVYPPGTIYRPNAEFMFRILGVAPANLADNTFCPVGRYEAATKREPPERVDRTRARMGVDVARYGNDAGTLYIRHAGRVWRPADFREQDTNAYARVIKAEALSLARQGVTSLHIRIDAGGGFGGGVVDKLKIDMDLIRAFEEFRVLEVYNNGVPYDADAFLDSVTEMYYHAGESLKALALVDPPAALEADLCERTYDWVNNKGVEVKRLQPKEKFKKEHEQRSPDDGDGLVLAVAPDFIFPSGEAEWLPVSQSHVTM